MSGAPVALTRAATASAILLMSASAPSALECLRGKSAGERAAALRMVKALSVFATYMNCMLWGVYGIFVIFAAFPPNLVGVLLQLTFVSCCTRAAGSRIAGHEGGDWTDGTAKKFILAALFATGLVAVMVVVALTLNLEGIIFETIGYTAMVFNVMLFGAPLASLREVLRERSSAALPHGQCFAALICSALWTCVAILERKLNMLVPNVLGVSLGLLQVGLILALPSKPVGSAKQYSTTIVPVMEDPQQAAPLANKRDAEMGSSSGSLPDHFKGA
mmetsp:Transcript_64037/g.152716  ORF Transcript_64037/g.152716 Transcript_64037/m.152716 type:complete len:275 (+) Transcript_64037:75-899(+)